VRGTLLPARVSTQPAQGAPHGGAGRRCGWEKQLQAGGRSSAVKRVLRGSGLLTAPDDCQDISEGTFQGEGQGRDYYKEMSFSESVFSFLLLKDLEKELSRFTKSLRLVGCNVE